MVQACGTGSSLFGIAGEDSMRTRIGKLLALSAGILALVLLPTALPAQTTPGVSNSEMKFPIAGSPR